MHRVVHPGYSYLFIFNFKFHCTIANPTFHLSGASIEGVLDSEEGGAESAIQRLARVAPFSSALCAITGDWTQRSWMHPSVVERIAFLRRSARDPDYAAAFRWRIDMFSALLVAAYLVGLVMVVW